MRIIARRTLKQFWEQPQRRDAEQPLRAWFSEASAATWKMPTDVKKQYRNASILKKNRIVFNISGNKYRLIVAVRYDMGIIFIRFVGSHEEYDKIDPEVA